MTIGSAHAFCGSDVRQGTGRAASPRPGVWCLRPLRSPVSGWHWLSAGGGRGSGSLHVLRFSLRPAPLRTCLSFLPAWRPCPENKGPQGKSQAGITAPFMTPPSEVLLVTFAAPFCRSGSSGLKWMGCYPTPPFMGGVSKGLWVCFRLTPSALRRLPCGSRPPPSASGEGRPPLS